MQVINPQSSSLRYGSWREVLHERRFSGRPWMIIPTAPCENNAAEVHSFADLYDGATRVAHGILGLKLAERSRIVIALESGFEFALAYFGALLAGHVPVACHQPNLVANATYAARRVDHVIRHSRASLVVTDIESRRRAEIFGGVQCAVLSVSSLFVSRCVTFLPPAPALGDSAILQYTSGSTGRLCAVELTQRNVLCNVHAITEWAQFNEASDRICCWLPMFHDMGLIGSFLTSVYAGVPIVTLRPRQFLMRPDSWLWAIDRFKGTLSAAPNFAYKLATSRSRRERLRDLDIGSWRAALNGAESVEKSTVDAFCSRFAEHGFAPAAMTPVYGLAENTVGCCFSRLDRPASFDSIDRDHLNRFGVAARASPSDAEPRSIACVGRPLAGQAIRVRVDGREALEREAGSVEVNGDCVARSYFDDAQRTAATFGADAWLRTRDRGYIANGEIYLLGRESNLIKRAGQRYDAEDIEALVRERVLDVPQVAVVAIANEESGTDELVVIAETASLAAVHADDLIARVARAVHDGTGVSPEVVELVRPRTIPRTTSGKINHEQIRRDFRSRRRMQALTS